MRVIGEGKEGRFSEEKIPSPLTLVTGAGVPLLSRRGEMPDHSFDSRRAFSEASRTV